MRFNVIIGNPPYNVLGAGGGADDGATSIYHYFVKVAQSIDKGLVSMIIPSKWMVGGRKELEVFRKEMKTDVHFRLITDYADASQCFSGVHIDGGVCYFLWDRNYKAEADFIYYSLNGEIITSKRYLQNPYFPYIVRDSRILSIIDKTGSKHKFSEMISNTRPYGIRGYLFNEPNRYPESGLQMSYFEGSLKVYGARGIKGCAKRTIGFVKCEFPSRNLDTIDKHKLFFTTSYSTNAVNPPEIIIAEPGSICTETFLLVGPFDDASSKMNCYKYMNTCFFKFLLFYGKGTMHVTSAVFSLVPLQDFTSSSDIDWSQSIDNIDSQLYKKYNLSSNEISFIEAKIKPN